MLWVSGQRFLLSTYPQPHISSLPIPEGHQRSYRIILALSLAAGANVSSVNGDLRYFVSLMRFLQEQDYPVPQALLRLHNLKQPERLPKFLTDEQVRALREDFEQRWRAT